MGPTNIAMVNLFKADQVLRAAQARLESASRSVRVMERRISEMTEKLKLAQQQSREHQARQGQLDLDIKSREEHIEKLRAQQQMSKNHKEYQAFLTEINTEKIDRAKVEDELLKVMEQIEKIQPQVKDLTTQIETEQKKCEQTRQQLGAQLTELQADVERLQKLRDEAAAAVPGKALEVFERLADRFEGEAMGAIGKPNRRREEYVCNACNMSLVADIYNRLHSRDDMVYCPSCRRLLYIPDDLPPELALNKPKERKERRGKAEAAAVGRQTSAADIARSIAVEEDDPAQTPEAPENQHGSEPQAG
jgi:predicted  nucleic acid-binding Zn-ribbon protein